MGADRCMHQGILQGFSSIPSRTTSPVRQSPADVVLGQVQDGFVHPATAARFTAPGRGHPRRGRRGRARRSMRHSLPENRGSSIAPARRTGRIRDTWPGSPRRPARPPEQGSAGVRILSSHEMTRSVTAVSSVPVWRRMEYDIGHREGLAIRNLFRRAAVGTPAHSRLGSRRGVSMKAASSRVAATGIRYAPAGNALPRNGPRWSAYSRSAKA